MKQTDFLRADTNSGKLQVTSMIQKWVWLRGCINLVYLKNELMNWAVILHADSDAMIFD